MRIWRSAMSRHAGQLEARGELRSALALHRGLLDDDPLQEATYRDLMRLHDALGERAAALDQFARCERTLGDELGLEPLPETRLLASASARGHRQGQRADFRPAGRPTVFCRLAST